MNLHRMTRWARLVAIAALVPALAWAQEGPGSRRDTIEPDDPVDRSAGIALHTWDLMNISGLPTNSTLVSLWVGANDDAYVWATRPRVSIPLGTQTAGLVRPEDPAPPDPAPRRDFALDSVLLHWDGVGWTTVLERLGESAATVYGVAPYDVYASTVTASGEARLYHFDGASWRIERLPEGITGPVGDIVGDAAHVYVRAGDAILMSTGRSWRVVYRNAGLVHGHALVFLGHAQLFAPCCDGRALYDGLNWSWVTNATAMDIHGAYGARDAAGDLHLFAAGSCPAHRGVAVWQYCEPLAGSMIGDWEQCVREPVAGDCFIGAGVEMWGTGPHDVYAVAAHRGVGALLRFNGTVWSDVHPGLDMPLPTGIAGTRQGDVWITLRDGRILRGIRREPIVVGEDDPPPVPHEFAKAGSVVVRREAARSFRVEFVLPAAGPVHVGLFDVTGRRVAVLADAHRGAGPNVLRWEARDVRPGVYFCRVRGESLAGAARIVIAP